MKFPRTLIEFQDQFPDEEHCWTYLQRARWPHGFVCPRCSGRGSHFLASRRLEQCRTCRYQGSVTAGTVFHGTRVPLRIWFLGVFFLARHKKGISALQFQKDTGLGSTRRRGRCCTSFDRVSRPFPRHSLRATSRPTRPTSVAIAKDGTDAERARSEWLLRLSAVAVRPVVSIWP